MSRLNHPTLGSIQGLSYPSTVQYRNLPYAQFSGRFREASIQKGALVAEPGIYNATTWGPLCPQISNGIKFDFALAGAELPHQEKYAISEEGGLNLVVTVPKGIKEGELVPVVVWIHGGYWVVGGNSWPQYDLQNLVDTATKLGKPVISVAFNYRLGIPGLLASKELKIPGNLGLKDSVLAFDWIKRNIVGFGGDAENITAFGESAGAMLLSVLLQLPTPLFTRAMVMSGSATLRPSKTEAQQEALYNDVLIALDLVHKTPSERAIVLLNMHIEEMISQLPPLIHVGPSIESGFIEEVVNLNTISQKTTPDWCKEVVIGDCFHDASCFKSRVLSHDNNADHFIACIKHTLPLEQAIKVINAYEIQESDPAEISLRNCMELLTDLRWYLPILHTYDGCQSGSVTRYHFHQTNEFESQWKGLAAHLFDITLLLQNHREILSEEEIHFGEDMLSRFLEYAYDRGFLSPDEEKEGVVVWGPDGRTKVMSPEEYDCQMRKGRGQLLKELGWETCEKLANNLQFGI